MVLISHQGHKINYYTNPNVALQIESVLVCAAPVWQLLVLQLSRCYFYVFPCESDDETEKISSASVNNNNNFSSDTFSAAFSTKITIQIHCMQTYHQQQQQQQQ